MGVRLTDKKEEKRVQECNKIWGVKANSKRLIPESRRPRPSSLLPQA